MQIETLPISTIRPDPANARLHSARNLDVIAGSLARFGQQKPIVIDANNVCRAGNGTLAAAKVLGWTEIRAVRTDLTGGEASAYAILDNRSAELAEWDKQILGGILADPDIGDLGFNAEEMSAWLDQAAPSPELEEAENTPVGESFQVIAECDDEDAQRELYERLTQEGYPCRVLTL